MMWTDGIAASPNSFVYFFIALKNAIDALLIDNIIEIKGAAYVFCRQNKHQQ